jgi:hypothetical protein
VATPEALNDGYAIGMTLGAALLLGAVLLALIILRRPATTTPTDLTLAAVRGTDE